MAQKMPIKLQELCAASLTHPLPRTAESVCGAWVQCLAC